MSGEKRKRRRVEFISAHLGLRAIKPFKKVCLLSCSAEQDVAGK